MVATAQVLLVFFRDLRIRALSVRKVFNEKVLAEGCVAILKTALILNLQVEIIDTVGELIFVHIDQDRADLLWIELPEAELVHYDFAGDSHI